MKHVRLIGDSIRLGYQETVRSELNGIAEVWSPEGNCMHSVHHLFNLSWYLEQPADVIHFNCGLWDCRHFSKDSSEYTVPLDQYIRNLDFILTQVRKYTNAQLIWATITPVIEARYNVRFTHPYDPYRKADDSMVFNNALAPVLEKHNVCVNDLFTFVTEAGADELICEDGVHFTDLGNTLLGKRVADVIKHHF
jgi:lysophospholipase L1-like esterase